MGCRVRGYVNDGGYLGIGRWGGDLLGHGYSAEILFFLSGSKDEEEAGWGDKKGEEGTTTYNIFSGVRGRTKQIGN